MKASGRKGTEGGVGAAKLDVATSSVAQGVRALRPVLIAVAVTQQGVGELLLIHGADFVIRSSILLSWGCYRWRVVHLCVGSRRHTRRGRASRWDREAKAGRARRRRRAKRGLRRRRWSGGRGESTAVGHAVIRP